MVDVEIIPKSIDDIYSNLNSIMKVLQREYNLNESEIKAVAKIVIDEEYDSSINLFLLEKKMIDYVQSYVKRKIDSGDFTILEQYINSKQVSENSYDILINKLKRISKLLKKISYPLTLDNCINLINNCDSLKLLPNRIVSIKENLITSVNLKEIFNDDIVALLIEDYCKINNIKVDNSIPIIKQITSLDNDDSLIMYLKEIDKPLLSVLEERYLAYEKTLGNIAAKNEFIEKNLKLVVSIAKRYKDRGLPLQDLIQEGNLGLIKAVDRYDVRKECRFSTYAKWWIKKAIIDAIANKSRTIKVPIYMQNNLNEFLKVKKILEDKLNREPSIEEIAKNLNISVEEVMVLTNLQDDVISLNSANEDDSTSIEDRLSYIDDNLENVILKEDIKRMFKQSNLSKKEIDILTLRYGLDGNIPLTLVEIGKIYGVKRNYIGQIESRSLKKIRREYNKHEKVYD